MMAELASITLLWLLLAGAHARVAREAALDRPDTDEYSFEMHMPGVHPDEDDEYWCTSQEVPAGTSYITQYEALAEMQTTHHMILYGCPQPGQAEDKWKCGTLCKGHSKIMFAWARNAPPTQLPQDVGFEVGGTSDVNYLVLQIHYKTAFKRDQADDTSGLRMTVTSQRPRYQAGVMILLATQLVIPANAPKVHGDVSCKYNGDAIMHPFAFRTHAHDLGTVITGYKYNSSWTLMGKGNPQWPQAFYPMQEQFTIKPGDYLVARCTYDATNRHRNTKIGSTHNDEMCNFYFMFYTEYGRGDTFLQCFGNSYKELVMQLPPGNDVPPPPNAALDHVHHHAHGGGEGEDGGGHDDAAEEPVAMQQPSLPELQEMPDWYSGVKLGQVAGIATDSRGNLHVFHRGPRTWDEFSFDIYNNFMPKDPIKEDVLVTFSPDGKVINKWGGSMFYMPHGIFIDAADNIWVTDVAMHQVFRFPPNSHTVDRMFGQKLEPGHDDTHFCKPTDVTVISTGEVFVTDGYCNNRVMKFSDGGLLLKTFGTRSTSVTSDGFPSSGTFDLPHSITDLPAHEMVCVGDRENARIQCFDYNGVFKKQYHPEAIPGLVYALDYCPDDDVLMVVNGDDDYKPLGIKVHGFTLDVATGNVLQTWQPTGKQGFGRAHDVVVTRNGAHVYVADINTNRVYKFFRNITDDAPRRTGHPLSVDSSVDDSGDKELESAGSGGGSADFGASLVIGLLLVIPVLVIIVIVVFMRVRKQRISEKVEYKLVDGSDSLSSGEEEDEVWVKTQINGGSTNKKVHFAIPPNPKQ